MNAITFTCPLPAMDIAMLVARVVPGHREHALLAVVRPVTGSWILSPSGTQTLAEHGGGKFTFTDAAGDAARDVRVRRVLQGLGAVIAVAPPAPSVPPVLPGPPVGTVPVHGMPEAIETAPPLPADPIQPGAPSPARPAAFPAQRVRRFNR